MVYSRPPRSSSNQYHDDSVSNVFGEAGSGNNTGSTRVLLQDFLNRLDARQDKIETTLKATPHRPERVITDKSDYVSDSNDPNVILDGWYWVNNPTPGGNLENRDNELVKIVAGAIIESCIPSSGDEIKIGLDTFIFDYNNTGTWFNYSQWVREIEVATRSISGQYLDSAASFINLPVTDTNGNPVTNGDWAYLSLVDVGSGTVEDPQYPKGVYTWNGTNYSFSFAVGSDAEELLFAALLTGTENVPKLVSAKTLGDWGETLGTDYWLDPVIAVIDTAPGAGTEGDRYLVETTPPSIIEYQNGSFVEADFLDGARVSDGILTYSREGDKLNYDTLSLTRDRLPGICDGDGYPIGTEWLYQERIFKLVGQQLIGSGSELYNNFPQGTPPNTQYQNVDHLDGKYRSFVSSINGVFKYLRLYSGYGFAGSAIEMTLSLYKGNGIGGELLGQQDFSILTTNSPTLLLDCPIEVEQGETYTWQLTKTSAASPSFSLLSSAPANSTNYYVQYSLGTSNGYLWQDISNFIQSATEVNFLAVNDNTVIETSTDVAAALESLALSHGTLQSQANSNTNLINNFDSSPTYWLDPVIDAYETIPDPADFNEGDRILINSEPPEIKTVQGGSFVASAFPDGASVSSNSGEIYRRLANNLNYSVPAVIKNIAPTDLDINYAVGTEWRSFDNSQAWKLIDNSVFGSNAYFDSTPSYPYSATKHSLEPLPFNTTDRIWQSFVVAKDHGIARVVLYLKQGFRLNSLVLEIYKGVGIDGTLVGSKELDFTGSSVSYDTVSFNFDQIIPVREGEQYTYALGRTVAETNTNSPQSIFYGPGNLGVDNNPGQTNNLDVESYPFQIRYEPIQAASWVKMAGLKPDVEIANDILTVKRTVKAVPTHSDLPSAATASFEDRYLIGANSGSRSNKIAKKIDNPSGGFAWQYLPQENGDRYLIATDSVINPNQISVYQSEAVTFLLPAKVEALIETSKIQTLIWDKLELAWIPTAVQTQKAIQDELFFVDSVNGNDTNDGKTTSTAFQSLGVAIAKISLCCDFDYKFTYSIKDISASRSSGQITVNSGIGIPADKVVRIYSETSTKITATDSKLFVFDANNRDRFILEGFTLISNDAVTQFSVVENKTSTVTLKNLTLQGSNRFWLTQSNTAVKIFVEDLNLDSIDGDFLYLGKDDSRIDFLGTVLAIGTNSFVGAVIKLEDKAIVSVDSAASFNLDSGATITAPFAANLRANCEFDLKARNSLIFWNLTRIINFAACVYNDRRITKTHSHWISGSEPTIAVDTTRLDIPASEYVFYFEPNRQAPFWMIVALSATQLSFPATLTTNTEAYLYARQTGYSFDPLQPTAKLLSDRIYLGLAKTTDNVNFSEIEDLLIEKSTDALIAIAKGKVANPEKLFAVPSNGVNLKLALPLGNFLAVGRNFRNDPQNAHILASPAYDPLVWTLLDPTGTVLAASQQDLDFTQYWNGTNLVTLPADNDACLLFLYFKSPDQFFMVRGSEFYSSLEVAENRWSSEKIPHPPQVLETSVHISTLLGIKNASDSSNTGEVILISNIT